MDGVSGANWRQKAAIVLYRPKKTGFYFLSVFVDAFIITTKFFEVVIVKKR
jgi:hypothetical protein